MAPSESIAAIGERALIERIQRRAGPPPPWLHIGIGDDAAVMAPARNELDVITTDNLVEHVHFDREWSSAESIGWKAVMVNISDLAAMGAAPRAVLLSLALPASLTIAEFDALIEGVVQAAERSHASLIGGDISSSPGPLTVDVTAIGSVRPRRMLTRSGGRVGDDLYVTGTIGAAGVGLASFRTRDRTALAPGVRECIDRYERPTPQLRCGVVVGRRRAARAAIDLSDGLANAVSQLAEASGTGATIDADTVPVHPAVAGAAAARGEDALTFAMNAGEDYELLFAVAPRGRRGFLAAIAQSGSAVTRIGQLTRARDLVVVRNGQPLPIGRGYQHFSH